MSYFKLSKGRSGEFVLDKKGKRINLTGLIFGRHHELFNHASYLQVKQVGIGKVEIHYVAPHVSPAEAAALFDGRNVELGFMERRGHREYFNTEAQRVF